MKVLHVLETSIPHLAGYTIRSKYIVEHQKKHGIEPVVVTSPFFRGKTAGGKREEIGGTRYYRTNHIRKPDAGQNKILSYWTRFRMLEKYRREVLEIALEEKPDIIHAHSSYTNGQAANFVSRRMGVPSIYELRSLWGEAAVVENGLKPGSMKYRTVWNLELAAMKGAAEVIAISEGIRNEIVKRGISPRVIDIIPNGVDTSVFSPRDRDPGIVREHDLKDSFVIGYIGSIRKLEGLSLLLEAYRTVKREVGQTSLLIVGDGAERDALCRTARELGLDDVVFTGNVPHDDIRGYYSVIDLFVFPRIDAMINQAVTPLKPLEVMAAGKVCLCSDVGGLTEMVRDGYNGMVFNTGDAADLARKILSICNDRKRYDMLAANSIDWVKNERDWALLIPKYMKIYQKVIERHPGREGHG